MVNKEKMAQKHQALAKLEKLRRQSYTDFFTFCKYVVGHDLMEIQPHKELCDVMTKEPDILEWFKMSREERSRKAQEHGNIKKLIMIPRGCFKSTIATVDFPMWALWHDPNLRIMIDNENYKNSKKFLAEIKGILDGEGLIKTLLKDENGKYQLDTNKKVPGGFTEDSIILENRTIPAKEPSIFCSGADTAATGMHPDIIIMDDLVSERNVTTEDQIEKVKQHYRFAYSLLEPGGILIIIGTRYHLNDMYADIMEDDTFEHYVRPAVLKDGSYFFPERLGPKRLAELEKSQGSYIFNSQYMLNPLSSEDAVFRPEDIRYYEEGDLPSNINTYMTVDLAISQKERADYTVVAVSSVDEDNQIYVREYMRKRATPQETIDTIFNFYNKYRGDNLLKIGIEGVAFQRAMIYFLRDEMRRRGQFLPLQELKADTDKKRRAMGLAPWAENHAFFIKEHMIELKNEMLQFPLGQHDDCVDAVSYLPQIIRKPGKGIHRGVDTVYNDPIYSSTGY